MMLQAIRIYRFTTLLFCAFLLSLLTAGRVLAQPKPVAIRVDLAKTGEPLKPIWAWFGYDEPNYTYMKDGKKLLIRTCQPEPGARVCAGA